MTVHYSRTTKRAAQFIHDDQDTHVLLHQADPPDNAEDASDLRNSTHIDESLIPGVYVFDETDTAPGSAVRVLVVEPRLTQPANGTTCDDISQAPQFIVDAHRFFVESWAQAESIPTPIFAVRDLARIKSNRLEATILAREYRSGRWTYQIRASGRDSRVSESALEPLIIDNDPYAWIQSEPAGSRELMTTLTRTKLREQLSDTVYSFRSSRTVFLPYQFRPIMQLLKGGQLRLLIADEVGLGKTVEAGLVWTELEARNQANRVLVVCPPSLINKWQDEMLNRFGFELTHLDSKGLGDMVERLETGRLPNRGAWVCSLNTLRTSKYLEDLNEGGINFDLIIADEAHAFRNLSTKSYALGASLSDWADSLIFLSATPLNLSNDDLFNLLHLLSPGTFEDHGDFVRRLQPNRVLNAIASSVHNRSMSNTDRLQTLDDLNGMAFGSAVTRRPEFHELSAILKQPDLSHSDKARVKVLCSDLNMLSATVTRTRKIDIQEDKAQREVIPIEVEWTDEERQLYEWIDKWQTERARRSEVPVGFATQMPLRLASTCLPAFRDRLAGGHYTGSKSDADLLKEEHDFGERDDDLQDAEQEEVDRQFQEFFEEGGQLSDLDSVSVASALWANQDLDAAPQEVINAARVLGPTDTKFDAFIKAIKPIIESGRRILVFTFSRPTIAYLSDRLAEIGIRHEQLHGGVAKELRGGIMERFRANDFPVMLATKVASEGLDFEFASAVVNYDLPWNPMEVEQRIGRIDRIGQKEEKIYVLNFHVPGTIETDIVERVMSRIGVFEQSIGELEPIIRESMAELREFMFDFKLTEEQRKDRIDRTLTAIETKRHNLDQVQSATNYLQSTDMAEIEGLEHDLLTSGRYIGSGELLALLQRWIQPHHDAYCRPTKDNQDLYEFRGTPELAQQLEMSRTKGSWPTREVDKYVERMTDELVTFFSVDQQHAYDNKMSLLSVRHPFVRAAIDHIPDDEPKFSHVRVASSSVPPGQYLVALALAKWTGVRSTTEFWTADVNLASLEQGNGAGNALLAAIANGTIEDLVDSERNDFFYADERVEPALTRALHELDERHNIEEQAKQEENELLVDVRRISIQETYQRAIQQIDMVIKRLQDEGKRRVIPMHRGRRNSKERALKAKLQELDEVQEGHLEVETLGIALVEVSRPVLS